METTKTIATRLVNLLKEQQFVQAYRELFADDTVSIDPVYANEPPLKGLSLLIEREEAFLKRGTIQSIRVSEPLIASNHFTISLALVFTPTGQETRTLEELCVYHISAGKINSQQFFIG